MMNLTATQGQAGRWLLPADNRLLADADGDGIPDGWEYQGDAPPASAFGAREPGDPPALRLSAESRNGSWLSPAIPLNTAGPLALYWETLFEGPYHWTYWTDDCRVWIEFLDREGGTLARTERRLTCLRTLGWVASWLRTPAAPGATAVRFGFLLRPGEMEKGTMWVRGLAIEDLSQPLRLEQGQGALKCRVVDDNDTPMLARLYLRSDQGANYHPARSYYYEACGQPFHLEKEGQEPICHPSQPAVAPTQRQIGSCPLFPDGLPPSNDGASFELPLPAGTYHLLAMRGLEYEPAFASVTIEAGATQEVALRLRRYLDLPAQGWFCGDHHCHLHFHGSSRFANMRYEDLFHLAQGEGLNYLAIQADEHYFVPFLGKHRLEATEGFIGELDTEYTSGLYGHFSPVFLPTTPPLEGLGDHWPMNYDLIKGFVDQGGAVAYGHPYDDIMAPDPLACVATRDGLMCRELPIDLALGLPLGFDLLTQENDADFDVQLRDYYRMLNCGFKVAACGSTDRYNDQGRGLVGTMRTYAHAGKLDFADIAAAYRRGATFATNGPILLLEVNGAQPGDEIALASPDEVQVTLKAYSIFGLSRLELLLNGQVCATDVPGPEAVGAGSYPARDPATGGVETVGATRWVARPPVASGPAVGGVCLRHDFTPDVACPVGAAFLPRNDAEGGAPCASSLELRATIPITDSAWIAARAFGPDCEFVDTGHLNGWVREQGAQFAHTSPVWVSVGGKPVRASAADAQYFVAWIEAAKTYITRWRETTDEPAARERHWYQTFLNRAAQAQDVFRQIAAEATVRAR